MQIANKVYLVPFGETTNFLPKFLGKYVNKIFFKDAKDYLVAKKPTYFTIDNQSYKNAICYEATVQEMYQDNPKSMIAISNNGWYYPSIMPIIQKNMIQFLAKKYKVVIYHSTNKSKSEVIW
jgi:apolipoprotein N-acyltransferase